MSAEAAQAQAEASELSLAYAELNEELEKKRSESGQAADSNRSPSFPPSPLSQGDK